MLAAAPAEPRPLTGRAASLSLHHQLETEQAHVATLERELSSCRSSVGAMRMSRDGLKEKLFTAERAAAQQLRATEMSTGLLRQKLQQCETLLRDMATHTGEGQVDAAALRKQIVQLELSLSSERVQLDEARAGMLKWERQSAELLAQRTADAAAAKAAMVKAAAACRERDGCAKRTEQLQARLHVQECAAAAREAEGEAREAKLKKALGSARRQGAALEAQLVRAKSEAERALKEQRSTRAEAQKAATGHKREGGMPEAHGTWYPPQYCKRGTSVHYKLVLVALLARSTTTTLVRRGTR